MQDIEFSDSNLLKNIRVNGSTGNVQNGRFSKVQAPRPLWSCLGSRSLTLLISCHVNDVVAGAFCWCDRKEQNYDKTTHVTFKWLVYA